MFKDLIRNLLGKPKMPPLHSATSNGDVAELRKVLFPVDPRKDAFWDEMKKQYGAANEPAYQIHAPNGSGTITIEVAYNPLTDGNKSRWVNGEHLVETLAKATKEFSVEQIRNWTLGVNYEDHPFLGTEFDHNDPKLEAKELLSEQHAMRIRMLAGVNASKPGHTLPPSPDVPVKPSKFHDLIQEIKALCPQAEQGVVVNGRGVGFEINLAPPIKPGQESYPDINIRRAMQRVLWQREHPNRKIFHEKTVTITGPFLTGNSLQGKVKSPTFDDKHSILELTVFLFDAKGEQDTVIENMAARREFTTKSGRWLQKFLDCQPVKEAMDGSFSGKNGFGLKSFPMIMPPDMAGEFSLWEMLPFYAKLIANNLYNNPLHDKNSILEEIKNITFKHRITAPFYPLKDEIDAGVRAGLLKRWGEMPNTGQSTNVFEIGLLMREPRAIGCGYPPYSPDGSEKAWYRRVDFRDTENISHGARYAVWYIDQYQTNEDKVWFRNIHLGGGTYWERYLALGLWNGLILRNGVGIAKNEMDCMDFRVQEIIPPEARWTEFNKMVRNFFEHPKNVNKVPIGYDLRIDEGGNIDPGHHNERRQWIIVFRDEVYAAAHLNDRVLLRYSDGKPAINKKFLDAYGEVSPDATPEKLKELIRNGEAVFRREPGTFFEKMRDKIVYPESRRAWFGKGNGTFHFALIDAPGALQIFHPFDNENEYYFKDEYWLPNSKKPGKKMPVIPFDTIKDDASIKVHLPNRRETYGEEFKYALEWMALHEDYRVITMKWFMGFHAQFAPIHGAPGQGQVMLIIAAPPKN